MGATLFEVDARAGDQILDGARDEDLAGLGVLDQAGADVDCDPVRLAADELDLAGVQACAKLESELADCLCRSEPTTW